MIKEIGDGSFGSVCLARVRGAGASVARRGTMVSTDKELPLFENSFFAGRHQNNEEDVRIIRAVSRTSRGHFPPNTTGPHPSCPCVGYFLGSIQSETTHMHGIYGWESISIDEGERPQVPGREKRQEHTVSDLIRPRSYSRSSILSSRYQTRKHFGLDISVERFNVSIQSVLGTCHTTIHPSHIRGKDCRLRAG